MYNTIITELKALKSILQKGDTNSQSLINEINRNPSNFDLTYTVWTLMKGDMDVYLEELDKVDYPDPEPSSSEEASKENSDEEQAEEDSKSEQEDENTQDDLQVDTEDSNEDKKEEERVYESDYDIKKQEL